MKIYLIRHGRTLWNDESRYQGKSDIPLSDAGERELRKADFLPDKVYVSTLCRTWQTASILFPGTRQIIISGFSEMDFGIFEGKTAVEMETDIFYKSWVNSGCEECCPSGERRKDFISRVCTSFEAILDYEILQSYGVEKCRPLTIVAHGGVQMAIMEQFAMPMRDYFSWQSPPGGGFVLNCNSTLWTTCKKLEYLEKVEYTL